MKGFITKTTLVVGLAGGLSAAGGCFGYRDLVDPCYPQRYAYVARQELNQAFGAQVHNGHVLQQTVWNYHFETGTNRLTPAGMEHLTYLIRRRPSPDPVIYLATSLDIPYDLTEPEKFTKIRAELDSHRIQTVQKYAAAQTSGRALSFQVMVHDPVEVGLPALAASSTIQALYASYAAVGVRTLSSAPGSLSGGGGGGAAPAAGGGR